VQFFKLSYPQSEGMGSGLIFKPYFTGFYYAYMAFFPLFGSSIKQKVGVFIALTQ
jgi:hypothetical protein